MLTSFWKGISDNLRKVVTLDADRPELIIDVELDVVQAHAHSRRAVPPNRLHNATSTASP